MAIIIAAFVAGGFWRRIMGGWGGLPRSWIFVGLGALYAPLAIWWPWYAAAGIAAWSALYWSMGHLMEDARKMLKRYGLVGLIWPLLDRFWPRKWVFGSFLDGAFAVAELLAGGIITSTFYALAVLSVGA